MRTSKPTHLNRGAENFRVALLVVVAGLCASPAWAGFIGGGGKAEADCYAGVDVTGVPTDNNGNRIQCVEGEECDASPCGDGKCTFEIRVCANRSGVSGCTAPSEGLASLKAAGPLKAGVPSNLTGGAVCGDPLTHDLKLKKNSTKQNKRVIRSKATVAGTTKPKKDQDSFLFVCLPRSSECPSSPSGAFTR